MKRLEVSGAVRQLYGSLGGKRLITQDKHSPCSGQIIITVIKTDNVRIT